MKLLIIEDNHGLREQMKWALHEDYTILEASSADSGIKKFTDNGCRLVCLDLGLDNIPDKGLDIIDALLHKDRKTKIIIITAHSDESLGNEAIRRGAFDYLRKPVNIDELKIILERAGRLLELEEPDIAAGETNFKSGPDFNIIGECEVMQKVFRSIERLSQTDVTVLITGESGTGKELCARAIHFHSSRNSAPFVPINCGAIPETLLESELFGYAKGAFTGAQNNKKGLIESANNGTLFLDEIGDMPQQLQAKLLRFLEDRKYQRLGDVSFYQADVRIIAATNRKDLVIEDNPSIRSDLYYRLCEYEIYLPPLRERGNDILLIAQAVIVRNRERFNLPKLKLSSRTTQLLQQYPWPGNVRELENKLSRAALSCVNQVIEPEDLQLPVESYNNLTLKEAKDLFEKNFIINALRQGNYTIAAAARGIGVSRPTLYDMIKKHGITIKKEARLLK